MMNYKLLVVLGVVIPLSLSCIAQTNCSFYQQILDSISYNTIVSYQAVSFEDLVNTDYDTDTFKPIVDTPYYHYYIYESSSPFKRGGFFLWEDSVLNKIQYSEEFITVGELVFKCQKPNYSIYITDDIDNVPYVIDHEFNDGQVASIVFYEVKKSKEVAITHFTMREGWNKRISFFSVIFINTAVNQSEENWEIASIMSKKM